MAQGLFTVDGVSYNVRVPSGGLQRNFKVLDGPNAGRMLDGSMTRDVMGTFYNYTLTIDRAGASAAEYDNLYQVLSAPAASHSVVFPYGQTTLSFQAYVTEGQDVLLRRKGTGNYWAGLSVQFVAMAPQRR